jgi:hypothetical protein
MTNHIYQFENKCRIQKQGGPIGLKLTVEIANCIMINWDKEHLSKLKHFKMIPEIYARFKDDIEVAIESLEKGCKVIEDRLLVSTEVQKVLEPGNQVLRKYINLQKV